MKDTSHSVPTEPLALENSERGGIRSRRRHCPCTKSLCDLGTVFTFSSPRFLARKVGRSSRVC